jgi:hypothetical protein
VLAALTIAQRIGLVNLLPRRGLQRRRDLALVLIVARLLDPAAKLATARMLDRDLATLTRNTVRFGPFRTPKRQCAPGVQPTGGRFGRSVDSARIGF